MAAQGILDFLRGQTCLRQEASYCPVRDPVAEHADTRFLPQVPWRVF